MARRKPPRFFKAKATLRKALKAFLMLPARSRCQLCDYSRYSGNLSFHHLLGFKKNFNISEKLLHYTLKTLIKEASKCILICHNCHGEVHANMRSVKHLLPLSYKGVPVPPDIIDWFAGKHGHVFEQRGSDDAIVRT